jgi:hypothetical protein
LIAANQQAWQPNRGTNAAKRGHCNCVQHDSICRGGGNGEAER